MFTYILFAFCICTFLYFAYMHVGLLWMDVVSSFFFLIYFIIIFFNIIWFYFSFIFKYNLYRSVTVFLSYSLLQNYRNCRIEEATSLLKEREIKNNINKFQLY